jgi:hypothetical protein
LSYIALSFVAHPLGGIGSRAQIAPITPLSANDVSWLFPAPTKLDDLISMADLEAHSKPIWSDAAFHQFLALAAGPAGHVTGTGRRIDLPMEVRSKRAWYIAAVRFDPSAPGFSDEIRDQFGQELQIRLVVQPASRNPDGTIKVHDIAAHLIFEFSTGTDRPPAKPGCLPRPQPDFALSKRVLQGLVEVRAKVGEEATSGKPLGVHPGLADPATARKVRGAMKELLQRHLTDRHLGFMTITTVQEDRIGPDATKRWIFMAMANLKKHPEIDPHSPHSGFIALHAPTLDGQQYAEMFSENNTLQNRVVPTPYANNGVNRVGHFMITCQNAANPVAEPPIDQRIGYATADILSKRQLVKLQPVDQPYPDDDVMRGVLNTIAEPDRSHVFNTDCVSCHTETVIWQERWPGPIPGIDPCALPGDNRYNLRAFGWAPVQFDQPTVKEIVRPTVSRRAANETAKVLKFVNDILFPKSAVAPKSNEPGGAQANDCKQE